MTTTTSPFTRHDTADDVSEGIDLTGKRAIVTGAASGIGIETVRTLARRGADVTIAARRVDAAREVATNSSRPSTPRSRASTGTSPSTRARRSNWSQHSSPT
jgi:glutamyl-tRNA reductase